MRTVEKIVFERDNMQVIQSGDKFFGRVFEGGETFESEDFNTMEGAKFRLGITPTTEESNRMIAEFMGVRNIDDAKYIENLKEMKADGLYFEQGYMTSELKYDTDWNWLMKVVEKIESFERRRYTLITQQNSCLIWDNDNGEELEYFNSSFKAGTKIEATYQAVVEFIKWYNND